MGLETLEERALRRAREYVEWVGENGGKLPSSTSKDIYAKQLGIWLCNMRQAANGNGKRTLYPSVKAYLDEHLPGWDDSQEDKALKTAKDYVKWPITRDGILPKNYSKDATEKQLVEWIGNMRRATKGKGKSTLYPSVKAYLDEHLPGWDNPLEYAALEKAKEYVKWPSTHDGILPKQHSKDAIEKQLSQWMCSMRLADKGKGKSTLYPSVKAYLDKHLPGWDDSLEDAALKTAKEYVKWPNTHDGRLPKQYSKDATEKQLVRWMCHMRMAANGKGRRILYPCVKSYLDEHLPGWEQKAILAASSVTFRPLRCGGRASYR
jgi:hypothetical protein